MVPSDYAEERFEQGLHALPAHMRDAVRGYFYDGIPPGGFLSALLKNDLMGALGKADEENLAALPAYGRFLYNCVPCGSYGSPENYAAWLASQAATIERPRAALDKADAPVQP